MKNIVISLAAGAFVLAGSTAQAATIDALDLLTSFNTIALADLNASSETEGTVFVGGNLNSNGYTVNSDGMADGTVGSLSGSLFVGGNVTGNPVNLNNGSAQISGDATAIINNNGSGSVTTGVDNIQSDAVGAVLASLSMDLGELTSTAGATIDLSDQNDTKITSGAGSNGVAILTLTEAESVAFLRNGANSKFSTIDTMLTTIINLYGSELTYSSNFNVDNSKVLLNFVDTTTLNIQGGAFGFSILAPHADINATGGGVNGTVVGNTINQRIEFRPYEDTNTGFDGDLPSVAAVPLPAAAWMLIAALGSLSILRRRTA